jgi:hypothetical protein
MLVRDVNGKIHIISRTACKNDTQYYEKLYNIRLPYATKYKSVTLNALTNSPTTIRQNTEDE